MQPLATFQQAIKLDGKPAGSGNIHVYSGHRFSPIPRFRSFAGFHGEILKTWGLRRKKDPQRLEEKEDRRHGKENNHTR